MSVRPDHDYLWVREVTAWFRCPIAYVPQIDSYGYFRGPSETNIISAGKAEFLAKWKPCCYFLTNDPELFPGMRGFTPTDSEETTEDAS